jgi:VanZ family protein
MSHIRRLTSSAAVRAWWPVLAVMALIFFGSAQPKHPPPAGSGAIYFSSLMPVFPGGWEFLVKKSGHMLAFGMLAALVARALLHSGLTPRRAAWLALLLAAGYALSDEFHQSFVPGRYASLIDIGFDIAGAVLATAIAHRGLRRAPGDASSP